MKKKIAKSKIEHPTWKQETSPTPLDLLMICDYCKKSEWKMDVQNNCYYHMCKDKKVRRLRRATKEETQEAKKITKVIDFNE